jgi:hypothetical protein
LDFLRSSNKISGDTLLVLVLVLVLVLNLCGYRRFGCRRCGFLLLLFQSQQRQRQRRQSLSQSQRQQSSRIIILRRHQAP